MSAGVCAFFLLSGFVITRSLSRYSRSGFVVGRLFRLLPTYAAAFLLGCAVYAGVAVIDGRAVPFTAAEVAVGVIPGLDIVLNLPAVANPVAWTLLVEITFYAICAIAYRQMGHSNTLLLAVTAVCLVLHTIAATQVFPPELAGVERAVHYVAPFLPVLFIGVQVASAGDRLERRDWVVIGVLFGALAVMTQVQQNPIFVRDAGFLLTEAVTVLGFLALWRWAGDRSGGRVLTWLAAISYPLYSVHLMLGSPGGHHRLRRPGRLIPC